jgi:hypothetical protein
MLVSELGEITEVGLHFETDFDLDLLEIFYKMPSQYIDKDSLKNEIKTFYESLGHTMWQYGEEGNSGRLLK